MKRAASSAESPPDGKTRLLTIQFVGEKREMDRRICSTATFQRIRYMHAIQLCCGCKEVSLIYDGRVLRDDETPDSVCMANHDIVKVESGRGEKQTTEFGSLLKSGDHSDFNVVADGQTFRLHKCILAARCPYFDALLKPHTAEAKAGRLRLPDIEPRTIKTLLKYIYEDAMPSKDEMTVKLWFAASRFLLNPLSNLVGRHLSMTINSENVCDTLIAADMLGNSSLKEAATQFVAKYRDTVSASRGWKALLHHPQLVADCFKAIGRPTPKKPRVVVKRERTSSSSDSE